MTIFRPNKRETQTVQIHSMEGEIKSLTKVWLTVLAAFMYCYFIASKIPKGKLRLFSLFPIFFLFTTLPLLLSPILPSGIFAFFITWLSTFKLLLFAFDLGPLASEPPKSFFIFTSIACFPIKINKNETYPSGQNHENDPHRRPDLEESPPKLPLKLPVKILIFAVLVGFDRKIKFMHPHMTLCIYCATMYLFLDILVGLCNVLVRWILGMELELPSNEPYLATSLQDFWGRRWNLIVSNALRCTVYRPVRSAAVAVLSPLWAPVPAVLAAFLVSGLMHELIFYYILRATPTWEVTWFFVLHGVCVLMEFELKRTLGKRRRLHRAVSGPLTVAFVVVTAAWLFFPPVLRTGAVTEALGESTMALEFVHGHFTLAMGKGWHWL